MTFNPNIDIDDSGDRPVISSKVSDGRALLRDVRQEMAQFRADFPTLTDIQRWQRLESILTKIIDGSVFLAGEIRK